MAILGSNITPNDAIACLSPLSIPELREYVSVDQYEFLVEQYIKNEAGQWLFQEYEGNAVTVFFASVGVQMSMSDIYESVVFNTKETEMNQ